MPTVQLKLLDETYGIAQLAPDAPYPAWASGDGFTSITRTTTELSVVCRDQLIPPDLRADRQWRCIQLVGPFALDQSGIVLSVIRPLSEAEIGIFVISTFDGDVVLVKARDLPQSRDLLIGAGHSWIDNDKPRPGA